MESRHSVGRRVKSRTLLLVSEANTPEQTCAREPPPQIQICISEMDTLKLLQRRDEALVVRTVADGKADVISAVEHLLRATIFGQDVVIFK